MFGKTSVSNIVQPISKIAVNLRAHSENMVTAMIRLSKDMERLGCEKDSCAEEVRAATRLADKLEKLLSVDDED